MPSRKSVSAEACNCWINLSARESARLNWRMASLSRLDFESDTVRGAERALAGALAGVLAGLLAGLLARPRPGSALLRFAVAPDRSPALVSPPCFLPFFFMGPPVEACR